MFEYCKANGAKFDWLKRETAEHLFKNSEYQYLMNNDNKKDFAEKFNLTQCLEERIDDNNTLANLSQLSYDDLVRTVLLHDFKDGNCRSARFWSPGQPDGNSTEMCIVLSKNDLKMHDINCNVPAESNTGFVCTYPLPQIHV